MAYRQYDTVIIQDIRNNADCPGEMKPYSGQTAHIMKVITAQMYSGPNGNELRVYYELDIDGGKGLWPERFLKPYVEDGKSETEWIDTILRLISDIETKCDLIKRELWRRKHG